MGAFQTARFYELLGNRAGRLEKEGPLLLEALERVPSRQVADVACGLGLHAVWLADRGAASVNAFDLSPEMVRHAQETRPHERVRYAAGDMREIASGPYGLIICLGNSLSLLSNREDLRRFFSSAWDALLPGGLLIAQTLNYDKPALRRARARVERAETSDGELVAVKRFQPRGDHTVLTIDYHHVAVEVLTDITETAVLRHWSPTVLQETAGQVGFKCDGLFGDYEQSPLTEESPDILFRVRRSV